MSLLICDLITNVICLVPDGKLKKKQKNACVHVCMCVCVWEIASHTGDRCMRSHYGNVVMKSIWFESESTFWTFHFKLCNGWIYLEQELRGQHQLCNKLGHASTLADARALAPFGSLVVSQRLEAGKCQSKPFGGKPQLCGCGFPPPPHKVVFQRSHNIAVIKINFNDAQLSTLYSELAL